MTHLGFAGVGVLMAIGVVAQVTNALPTEAGPIASLGAVGVLIALVWFLVMKQGPKERQGAQDHTERVVGLAFDQYKEQSERDRSEVQSLVKAVEKHVDQAGVACPHIGGEK